MSILSVDKQNWTETASSFVDYNFEQSHEYATSMADRAGASTLFLAVHAGDRLLGAASVRLRTIPLLGRGVAYVSGGPITCRETADDSQGLGAVVAALKRKLVDEDGHFLLVRLPVTLALRHADPKETLSGLGFIESPRARPYKTIVVDVRAAPDALRGKLAGKWRTDLGYAERAGLCIEKGSGRAMVARFLELFHQMHDAKGFDVRLPPDTILSMAPEGIGLQVLIATKDGEDAAGHVLSLLGDTAVYLFGATNELGRATKAGYLLNWEAILLAKARGIAWYDLGGIDAETNPGVYRFKSRMGGLEAGMAPYEARPAGITAVAIEAILTLRNRLIGTPLLKSRRSGKPPPARGG